MGARGRARGPGIRTRALAAAGMTAVVAGLVYTVLTGDLGVGALVFATGMVLLGVLMLGGRDRRAGWVLIAVGLLTAAGDVLRLLLFGPW